MIKTRADRNQGFTLIELLVVILIIGIIAAIAVPVFLRQRQKAVYASLLSDARSGAQVMETKFADAGCYAAITSADAPVSSPGNLVIFKTGPQPAGYCFQTYCVYVYNPNARPTFVVYDSDDGGIMPSGTTATCNDG